jgi:hypothetical protein
VHVPPRVIAFPRDEDVPATPILAHRSQMLPQKVTFMASHIVPWEER